MIDKALTFDTIVHYVGERRMDNDQANFQPLISAYTTMDVQLGGQINQFFWSAGVANLFDVEYFDYSVASAFTLGSYNAYPPARPYLFGQGWHDLVICSSVDQQASPRPEKPMR